MKKFVLKSLPYLAIILAYGLLGEFLLLKNKESYSIETVNEEQNSSAKELYYGREILGNSLSNYKFQRFISSEAKVLVLGQSVTLQFRDFMFSPFEDQFYNTGLMARNGKDLNYVLDLMNEGVATTPDLVLLGVDLSFFLEHTFLDQVEWTRNYPEDRALSSKSHLKGMQRIFLNRNLWRLPDTDVGFGRAGMRGRGYRNDGSYRHEGEINRYLEDSIYRDGTLIEDLKNRRSPFIEPFRYSEEKTEIYLEILERFRTKGIELILYIPPYSDEFFNQAMQDEMFSSFWSDFIEVQNLLKSKGYNVIEFTTPSGMGLSDDYMADAEHPGEVFCALQLKQAVEKSQIAGKYINQLSFDKVNSLLEGRYLLPLSFMQDSIGIETAEAVIEARNKPKTD